MSFGVDHVLSALLVLAVVAVGVWRARDLGGRAGVALALLEPARRRKGTEAWVDALVMEGEGAVVAELARAASDGDDMALEVAIREQRSRLLRGLRPLRVLGAASTAWGFCGALFHVAWMAEDHGLLDLDPTRIAHEGLSAAALSVALGVAGSGLAVSTLMALQDRARELGRQLDAFVRQLER